MWSVVLEKANPLLHSKQATQPLKLIHPAFEASKSLEAQYETFPVFLPRPGQLSLCHAWAFLKGVHEKLIFDSFRIPGKSGHTKTALLGQAEEAIQFALCSLCFSLSCCFSLLFCHRFHCSFGLIFFWPHYCWFCCGKKHGEALREAIILCTGFGLLLFCCLLILLVSV